MYIPEAFAAENLAWAHKIMAAHAKLAPQYQLTHLFPHLQKRRHIEMSPFSLWNSIST